MFRALLWKEWRELWVLPAVAAPLAAMSFLLTKGEAQRLTPVVWETGFLMWLVAAATYIPTHLLAREKDNRTAEFLFSRPTDRFRLWWLKTLVGMAALAAVGVVLYGVIEAFGLAYTLDNSYRFRQTRAIQTSINMAFVFFCLASFYAALFKKQLHAIIGVIVTLLTPGALGIAAVHRYGIADRFVYYYSHDIDKSFLSTLVICPGLLLCSLLLFARGSIWKETKSRLALVYSVSAIAVAVATAAGIAHTFPGLTEKLAVLSSPKIATIQILDMSEDGTRMLVQVNWDELFLSVDTTEKRVSIIGKGRTYARMNPQHDALMFSRHSDLFGRTLSTRLILSDFDGENKRTLLSRNGRHRTYLPVASWSRDGQYMGFADSTDSQWRRRGFATIWGSDGNLVRNEALPLLEDAWISSIGWDNESRFYYWKMVADKGHMRSTFWRIRPGDDAAEELEEFADNNPVRVKMGPNAEWILFHRWNRTTREDHEWRLYNIASEESFALPNKQDWGIWSNDASRIAWIETEEPDSEEDPNVSRLVMFDPETRETVSTPIDFPPDSQPFSWSQSGRYLLFRARRTQPYSEDGEQRVKHITISYSYSLETGQFKEIMPKVNEDGFRYRAGYVHSRWLPDDKMLWAVGNRLMATEHDGSNPKEIFRVENGKFYFDGEEQT